MSIIKYLLGWPLSAISLFFVYRIVEPKLPAIIPKFSEINWQILFYGFFCFFLYFLLRGVLWSELLKLKGYKIPFKKSLFFWNTSELKRYAPGNIWSFLGRTVSFSNLGVKKGDVLNLLLIESELIVAGTTIVSLMSLGFIFRILPDFLFEPIAQPLILLLILLSSLLFIFNPLRVPLLPKFSPYENFKLLVISTLTFFIWGVGNYLTASSLFFLIPQNFLSFVGFFSLSLLIGYLSVITPMGLGVREGVLTFGLSKILSLEVAGFISIFVRIIFIISEIVFLFFAWVWQKTKNVYIERIENLITQNIGLTIAILFSLIYFVYMSHATFLRYDNFYAGRFDLGNMDQTVWNTIHGRVFEFTNPDSTEIVSRLAFHSDFLLILLSPLYLIWDNPKILLLTQSLILAIGGIFVFLIASKYIKNKNIPLIITSIYFINPSLNYSNLFDFHSVVLGTTFLLGAFYFLKIKKIFLFTIFLILAVLSKEQVWMVAGMLGLYLFFFQKYKLLGAIIFLVSFVSFVFLMEFAFPNAAGGEHFALEYYSQFGNSPFEVVKNMLLSPQTIIPTFFEGERFTYLNYLFLPFAYLAVSPYLVFALPDLAINLISSNSNLYKIYFQYTAIITPFLFISVIWLFVFLKRYLPRINLNVLAALILFTSIYSAWEFGPLPGAQQPHLGMFTAPLANKVTVDKFLSKVPANYSVSATNNMGSKISQRRYIYVVPHGIDRADMIIFLLRKGPNDPGEKRDREILEKVKLNNNYIEIFRDEGFIVFQKKDLIQRPI